jgi:opacity protein-like surface antigen
MFKKCAGLAALVMVLSPVAAHADWLVTPNLGTTFGADTHGRKHLIFSGMIGRIDTDAFGWEADVSYAPKFFEGDSKRPFDFTGNSSNVLTVMANALIGVPIGGFRPYVTGGVGLMQIRVVSDRGTFKTSNREFGFNLGAGAMAFVSNRVGLRGDVRYFRSFEDRVPSWTRGIDFDIAPGNFDYWRATFGLTFRFSD